jgi:excisionase family DNA binding protein
MPSFDFQQDRLTRQQAAQYVGLKPATLQADVTHRRLRIPFYRLGSRVFYRRSDLDHWLESTCRFEAQEDLT